MKVLAHITVELPLDIRDGALYRGKKRITPRVLDSEFTKDDLIEMIKRAGLNAAITTAGKAGQRLVKAEIEVIE
uniref:Uncharacterized protein n=1 Tax=viral metagenome TaxID=1070528 RepID=A0A6M3JJX9_9ZZZZ